RLKGAPTETRTVPVNKGTNGASHQGRTLPPPSLNGGTAAGIPIAAGIAAVTTLGLPGAVTATGAPLAAAAAAIAPAMPPIHGFSSQDPPTISAIEATLRGGSQQQIADMIRYQQESQHREALAAAAAAGLGPDATSLLGSSTPLIRTTDRSSLVVNGLLQHQREMAQQQQAQQQQLKTTGLTPEMKQAPQVQEQKQHSGQSPSQDGNATSAASQQQPPTPKQNGEATAGARSTPPRHDEMAALLAVSAQRRREEELALLMELSKTKGVDV
ncbi:MAG: hypothetical protein SGILL_008634, partial [Bacillariaceae sp.]